MKQPAQAGLTLGLVINPLAGLGGTVALKGSDGPERQQAALELGAQPRAQQRAEQFLHRLLEGVQTKTNTIRWVTVAGAMGGDLLKALQQPYHAIDIQSPGSEATTGQHTRLALDKMQARGIDLLIFVGGDGTARDVMASHQGETPVLGIPAGVKMHSGVFAVTPIRAAELVLRLFHGDLVANVEADIRDFDDNSEMASDHIQVRRYGALPVPAIGGYLQQTKVGGRESEPLALEEICAYVDQSNYRDRNLVLGPGGTLHAIKLRLGLPEPTLRGCDVLYTSGEVRLDVGADVLEQVPEPLLLVSFTRQQGFLFGRGNQQLSADFLNALAWPDDVRVVGTRSKLASLEGQALLVDTGDETLDQRLSGLVNIMAGYDDVLIHRISTQIG